MLAQDGRASPTVWTGRVGANMLDGRRGQRAAADGLGLRKARGWVARFAIIRVALTLVIGHGLAVQRCFNIVFNGAGQKVLDVHAVCTKYRIRP